MDDHYVPNSTPKLTLSKLPYKPTRQQPTQMLTPPLHPSLSIPFQWEEAPGIPRVAASGTAAAPPSGAATNSPAAATLNNKVVRCLDLPPRLLLNDDAKITIMPSPTNVLDGPYVGRSLSLACTFSFRKGPVIGPEGGRKFGSGRWGSFKEEEEKFGGRGSFDFSSKLGDVLKGEKNVKVTRVGRKRRFFSLSNMNSNLWGDIYSSFKHAVSWRRKR
ncbi:hypothetical protein ACJIZ3_003573 [Penstemon smallii]|uniref:Uncharacterized protein n=1 Tax=Penstemon smallii TaxID=265156 RepID=A0ABD3U9Z5_9LAMI